MFAKPFHTSGNTRLKGKDVKKFRSDLLKTCSIPNDTDVQWNLLAKPDIVKLKLAAPSRTVLYTDLESNVLAFDLNGKSDIVPTVYLLWNEPSLRQHVQPLIVHSPVSHYLLRGADPMLPGVLKASHELSPFIKGQLRAVYVNGNSMPFAIGDILVDEDTLASQGWKGKAMQMLHVVFDELSKMGNIRTYPDGFSDTQIHSLQSTDDLSLDGINLQEEDEVKPAASTEDQITGEDESKSTQDISENVSENMDDLLERCFYQAIKKVKPSDAPMLASQFYASYVLPSRPVGSTINLKATKYKKISFFLKEMELRGIVELKEHDGVQTITLFRKTHPDISRHEMHRSEWDVAVETEAESTSGLFIPGKYVPEVIQIYKLTQQTQIISPDTKSFLHFHDIRQLLNDYITNNNLIYPNDPQFVLLNMHLTDALYHGKKNSNKSYPEKLSRQEIFQLFLNRLKSYHSIQLTPNDIIKPILGEFRPIFIKTELTKRQKPVTIVSNLMQFGINPELFSREAQKKWACSATIIPHGKDIEIHIQGNLGHDIVAFLGKEYKIPSKYCFNEYGKGLKPKK